ncbi:MAG: class I SAM-dependent methyltransferase [Gammaproteobacteria bacterium]|nr:class I SAM-dependent methyltransferase [Gammaproteobacteria bacterium]
MEKHSNSTSSTVRTVKGQKKKPGYNERLFSGGFRSKLHLARFHWISREITKRQCPANSVLELGCFDGKLLEFLPKSPMKYLGYDANWEGGLDIAREKWRDTSKFTFLHASKPEEMSINANETYDIAVAMETLEHVTPDMVDGYLEKISKHLDGYFFVTVPNEKGLVFLVKWLAKKLWIGRADNYTSGEFVNALLGRMHLVSRHEHKGFDYQELLKGIEKHFDVIDVSSIPYGFMPNSLSFGIGVVAKSKATT